MPLYGYKHSDPGGENGSAIVGGPRYLGTSNYPSSYVGKVFIGDYARDRMQVLDLSTGDPTSFGTAGTWGSPVDIQIAPDGNVAVLGIYSAQLLEIVYSGSNSPPEAVAHADKTSTTASSLTVHFSSQGSSDPDGNPITTVWDFGDGSSHNSAANPAHNYTHKGVFTATLTVSDNHGASSTASIRIVVGVKPPVVSFNKPTLGTTFKIGDKINIDVNANDPQDGPLGGDDVAISIKYWTGGHVFPVNDLTGLTGSFVAADNGFVSAYYQIIVTAIDSLGLTTTITRHVDPQLSKITVTASVPNVVVAIDGINRKMPYSFTTIVGSEREIAAPSFNTSTGADLVSPSISIGGKVAHNDFVSYTAPPKGESAIVRYSVRRPTTKGYWAVDSAGTVHAFGLSTYGDLTGKHLAAPLVGLTPTPNRRGYWLLGRDGGVFSYGGAPFYGSTGNLRLNKPVVSMAAPYYGGGYWFVATDGGIFSFGNAKFYGSTGAKHLNKPIVGMAATPSGHGYWLVASDGGIFAFGDAKFYGSTGGIHLSKPIVGMAATPSGHGYWLVASDGGIFAFGDAHFYGSAGALHLNQPIVGMETTPSGRGYEFVARDGGIFTFGDAHYFGSLGGIAGSPPIVGLG